MAKIPGTNDRHRRKKKVYIYMYMYVDASLYLFFLCFFFFNFPQKSQLKLPWVVMNSEMKWAKMSALNCSRYLIPNKTVIFVAYRTFQSRFEVVQVF